MNNPWTLVVVADNREAIVNQVKEVMGGLDIPINNVGTNIRKKALEYTEDEYAAIFQTNLISVLAICRLAYPLLKAGDSSILYYRVVCYC